MESICFPCPPDITYQVAAAPAMGTLGPAALHDVQAGRAQPPGRALLLVFDIDLRK